MLILRNTNWLVSREVFLSGALFPFGYWHGNSHLWGRLGMGMTVAGMGMKGTGMGTMLKIVVGMGWGLQVWGRLGMGMTVAGMGRGWGWKIRVWGKDEDNVENSSGDGMGMTGVGTVGDGDKYLSPCSSLVFIVQPRGDKGSSDSMDHWKVKRITSMFKITDMVETRFGYGFGMFRESDAGIQRKVHLILWLCIDCTSNKQFQYWYLVHTFVKNYIILSDKGKTIILCWIMLASVVLKKQMQQPRQTSPTLSLAWNFLLLIFLPRSHISEMITEEWQEIWNTCTDRHQTNYQ